ncbi:MAG: hypothetical protein K9L66_00490 [Spirochaetaceae bacterium]|nr:hypothetical protein [Spirochaetaceae bacterium]MCF7947089.1 hypothetical protein [Spirochaetia bacterium]MCF7950090.1 hypothetical protein [Spirochaetaceae bacterium]
MQTSSLVRSNEISPPLVTPLISGEHKYTGIRIAPAHSGLHKTIRNPQSLSGWYVSENNISPWQWNSTMEHQKWLYLTFSDTSQDLHPLSDIFHMKIEGTLRMLERYLRALNSLANREKLDANALYLSASFYDESGNFYFLNPQIAQLTQQNYEQLIGTPEKNGTGAIGGQQEILPVLANHLQLQLLRNSNQASSQTRTPLHLHTQLPQLNPRIADFLFKQVNNRLSSSRSDARTAARGRAARASSSPFADKILEFADEISLWLDSTVFENIHLEQAEERRKDANAAEQAIRKREKRRNFKKNHGSTVFISAAALLALAFFASPFVKNAFEPDITVGLTPVEVIELFYQSQNSLDHEAMNECTSSSAGKAYINQVTTLFVISRVRQGIEMKDVFTPAPEWVAAGQPELKDTSFVFGITDLNIRATSENRQFEVAFIKWSTLPPKAEELTSEEKMAEVASTDEVQAFRVKETVHLIDTSKGWKIDRIERTHYEPYDFRTAMQSR